MKQTALIASLVFTAILGSANAGTLWGAVDARGAIITFSPRLAHIDEFHFSSLDQSQMTEILDTAPMERLDLPVSERPRPVEITVPRPDGTLAFFEFVESPIMAPELAAKFPEIRTFLGQGVDDPAASIRFDVTPQGFHAQVLSPFGSWCVDPDPSGFYVAYPRIRPAEGESEWHCSVIDDLGLDSAIGEPILNVSGSQLRTYRAAVACTGEYAAYHGGTVPSAMAAIVTAMNRVVGIYEVEVAVRMQLVANNDSLVFTNADTDPYTNDDGYLMLFENQVTVDSIIGSSNYDIGHVFSTGGEGIASLGSVCYTSYKARGVTGLSSPVGDNFYVDYVAHEMGHQFGANHTFNGIYLSCAGGNRNGPTAYEPGSASTIMGYAGICGSDDLQPHSDPYFHFASYGEIRSHVELTGCAVVTATGNTPPSVNAGPDYWIPRSTPFTLTGSANDDGGAGNLTHCWEQRDLGPASALTAPDDGFIPLFRSYPPTFSNQRTFPSWTTILANLSTNAEKLPAVSRAMDFRLTVRDNSSGGGGVATDDMIVNVDGAAGPFLVTFPNATGSLQGDITVTWDVAGTNTAPINAANVNILLSINGGLAFPTTLLANTPNDGSETVTLPNISTSKARIMVAAADSIFFDVSNADFSIQEVFESDIEVSETSLNFGNLAPSAPLPTTLNFLISNPGNADLQFTGAGMTITGAGAGNYTIQGNPTSSSIAPAGSRLVEIAFDASIAGEINAVLTITTNDPDEPSVPIPLSGFGLISTTDLVQTLTGQQNYPQSLDEWDVNHDADLDAADVVSNVNAENNP